MPRWNCVAGWFSIQMGKKITKSVTLAYVVQEPYHVRRAQTTIF